MFLLLLFLYVWEATAAVDTIQDVFSQVVSLHPKAPRDVPKYMLELYWRNQYPDDDVIKSFLPQHEKFSSPDINWFQFITFNLSSLSSPYITRSELRLDLKQPSPEFQSYYHHRFKPRRVNLAPPVKLQLFLVKPNKVIAIDNVLFNWHKEDWISVDITAGIQELFLKSYKVGDHVMLGMRFKTMTGKVILPDSILKVKSTAGQKNLYTERIEQMKNMENIVDLLYKKRIEANSMKMKWEHLLRKQSVMEPNVPLNKPRSVLSKNSFLSRDPKYNRNSILSNTLPKYPASNANFIRQKRQNDWEIIDDWSDHGFTLPGDGVPYSGNDTFYHYRIYTSTSHDSYEGSTIAETSTTHESGSTSRSNYDEWKFSENSVTHTGDQIKFLRAPVTKNHAGSKPSETYTKHAEADINPLDAPLANNDDKFKPSEDTGRFSAVLIIHMNDKSRDRDTEEVEEAVRHLKRIKRNAGTITKTMSSQSCARKSLLVKFADLGWDHWIIEPQIFQAYYCSGKCAFPIAKSLFPTSHAYLQSAMFLVSGTPSPCCVPEIQSPLRALYQESPHVSVLRYFQNMQVESCSCR